MNAMFRYTTPKSYGKEKQSIPMSAAEVVRLFPAVKLADVEGLPVGLVVYLPELEDKANMIAPTANRYTLVREI